MTITTIEAWALAFIETETLAEKTAPPPPPAVLSDAPSAAPVPDRPGRPPELTVCATSPKRPGPDALRRPEARARLLHTFWHHELQAAELMCWALLRFSDSDPAFRRGLVSICQDEIRHMGLYADHLERLGFSIGAFPVRDWFWERVPTCDSAIAFVATLGMGLEGANLDHARSFADRFRRAGDDRAASIQERVGEEEIAHVAFAAHWFTRWTGETDFTPWASRLAAPLSPLLMRGKAVDRERRLRAGLSPRFIDDLIAWQPSGS